MNSTYRLILTLAAGMLMAGDLWADDHIHDELAFTPTSTWPTEAGNYYLTADIETSTTLNVPSDILNLDLNGHSIIRKNNGHVILVESGRTLNIYDCGTHVTYWTENASEHYWVKSDVATSLTTTGGCITGGRGENQNNINIDKKGDYSYFVGGGICNLGTLRLYGGNVVGNHISRDAAASGGGIYNIGNLTIGAGAKVIGNSIYNSSSKENSSFGAGVFNAYDAVSFVNNGEISHNYLSCSSSSTATMHAGGGVCNYSKNGITNNGLIAYNTCKSSSASVQGQGGGVYTYYGTFTNTGRIIGNHASLGGGVLVRTALVNSGEISDNVASDRGGGIQAWGKTDDSNINGIVTLNSGSKLQGNQCTGTTEYGKKSDTDGGYGGAIFVNQGSLTVNSGTEISGNAAAQGGAGIYHQAGSVTLMGAVDITGNTLTDGTTASNVLLSSGRVLTVGDDLAGASVGVGIRGAATGVVTSGYGSHVGTTLQHFRIDGIYTANSINVSGDEVAIGAPDITLAALADNRGVLTANAGQTLNVTLSGRTYCRDGYWNTLCLPFSLSAAQLAASPLAGATLKQLSASSLSGDALTLTFSDAEEIVAGQPYLARWESAADVSNPVFSAVTMVGQAGRTETDVVDFVGLLSTQTAAPSTDILLGGNNQIGYAAGEKAMKAFGAYFLDKSDKSGSAAPRIVLQLDDAAAGIAAPHGRQHTATRADRWLTLQGLSLTGRPSRSGIYVHNGRKEVVK